MELSSRSLQAIGLVGFIVSLVVASTSGADDASPGNRFSHRSVRIESPVGVVVYRLDADTGEICAFEFERNEEPRAYGCVGRAEESTARRYRLDGAAGTRATNQSWALRLDRVSGEICRFRLLLGSAPRLELAGCAGRTEPGTAAGPASER